MGGTSATGRVEDGVDTFVMLALKEGEEGWSPGGYFFESKEIQPSTMADDVQLQDLLLVD